MSLFSTTVLSHSDRDRSSPSASGQMPRRTCDHPNQPLLLFTQFVGLLVMMEDDRVVSSPTSRWHDLDLELESVSPCQGSKLGFLINLVAVAT